MTEGMPDDYQAILDQIHSNVFWERLKHHLDQDSRSDLDENSASELKDLVRRLQVQDESPSIDSEVIQKFLEDSEIRDNLLKATRNIMNSSTEESEE
ncbi:hypothetical protein [Gimesia sp.]|uniref:hypothetical protein n=1 Tax=Gimesia sp. TaxID=2024833 RepID=UPI0032EA9A54